MASLKELVDLYGPLGLKENKARVNPLEIMPPEASIPSPQAPLENRNLAADAALSKVPVSQPEISPEKTETPMEQMIRAQNEYKRQKLALLDPIIKRQEAAAEMQRNALDSYLRNTSAKLDISPLAALVDAQTGSKFSQSYKAPSNASDLSDKILKGEGAVGDSEQGIAATQLKAMGDQLGGKLAEAQLRQSATQGRADTANLAKLATDTTKGINEFSKEYDDKLGQLNKLEEVYNSGDYRQIMSLAGQTAAFIGGNKGATSDADAARQTAESLGKIAAKIETWLGGNGEFPKEEMKSMVGLIQKSKKYNSEIFNNRFKTFEDGVKTRGELLGAHGIAAVSDQGPLGELLKKSKEGITGRFSNSLTPQAGSVPFDKAFWDSSSQNFKTKWIEKHGKAPY